jgi:hypothetical protein
MARELPPDTLRLALGRRGGGGVSAGRRVGAALLVAGAIAVAVWPAEVLVRGLLASALLVLAAALHGGGDARKRIPETHLVADAAGIRRTEGSSVTVFTTWEEPFGLTVFASADTTTLLLAFTSPHATRFVTACRDRDEAPFARCLLERAVTITDSDLPTGEVRTLSPEDAERLVGAVAARAPGALERVYLSDASGEPLTLEPAELRIGAQRIDLAAPLEWRAFLFQERGAQAASVCQATWVRQADTEVVLVAPMPGDSGWLGTTRAAFQSREIVLSRETRTALARDMRLMQASAGDPPPRELRHAIDRVFMLPMRRALDRAPRTSRTRPSLHDAV